MEYQPTTEGPSPSLLRKTKRGWSYARLEIRVRYRSAESSPYIASSPQSIHEYALSIWDNDTIELQEDLLAIFLGVSMNVIGHRKISRGDRSGVLLFVQLICAIALNSLSSGVVIVHNHPSKSLKPSMGDIETGQKLRDALDLFNIRLYDSLIINKKKFYSLEEHDLLDIEKRPRKKSTAVFIY